MKQILRRLGIGAIAASSIGVAALSGCRSNDAGPLADATPSAGRVAKVAWELSWPPGSAKRQDCGGPAQPVSQVPARYAPAVWTQRPTPAADMNPPPSQPAPVQTVACAPPAPSAPASDVESAPKAVAANQTEDAVKPDYLPEALPNGKVVSVSEPMQSAAPAAASAASAGGPARSTRQDAQSAAVSEPNNGKLAQASLKSTPVTSAKKALSIEPSSSARPSLTVDAPSLSDFAEGNSSAAQARQNAANFSEPVFHVVNNKRIKLHFEVKDTGPAGISGVELWYIHENREWKKPEAAPQKLGPYVLEVDSEGLYGFKLIARNSQGGGEPAPRAGDPPQVWVLVDLTKPVVRINSVKVLQEGDGSRLELSWTAKDKNLGHRPVTLFYADRPEGPWLPMVANMDSTGACQKRLPPHMPKRFLVRAEAIDIAGNIGTDQTRQFVELEAPASRVSILKID